MIVVCPVTQQSYEIFPHKLVPFPRRCYWNFFTMTWITDQIIPSPYQLECEFNPSKFYPETSEPTSDILASDNNNPDEPLKQVCIWDELNFELLGFAPETHRYYKSAGGGQSFGHEFLSVVDKEFTVLRQPGAVPEGVWVRAYENRLDLLSVLMVGPSQTPYEEGVFLFDMQLTSKFPLEPPRIHFVSYTPELSPVMSWDGNFCVSALEWDFKKLEMIPNSYLMNLLIQIQGSESIHYSKKLPFRKIEGMF
jgi:ubiquitin-protein ligase